MPYVQIMPSARFGMSGYIRSLSSISCCPMFIAVYQISAVEKFTDDPPKAPMAAPQVSRVEKITSLHDVLYLLPLVHQILRTCIKWPGDQQQGLASLMKTEHNRNLHSEVIRSVLWSYHKVLSTDRSETHQEIVDMALRHEIILLDKVHKLSASASELDRKSAQELLSDITSTIPQLRARWHEYPSEVTYGSFGEFVRRRLDEIESAAKGRLPGRYSPSPSPPGSPGRRKSSRSPLRQVPSLQQPGSQRIGSPHSSRHSMQSEDRGASQRGRGIRSHVLGGTIYGH